MADADGAEGSRTATPAISAAVLGRLTTDSRCTTLSLTTANPDTQDGDGDVDVPRRPMTTETAGKSRSEG